MAWDILTVKKIYVLTPEFKFNWLFSILSDYLIKK